MAGNAKRALGKLVTAIGAGVLVTGTLIAFPLLAETASASGGGAAYTANDITAQADAFTSAAGALIQPTATAGCHNGKATANNCNIYPSKNSVWLNAGPIGSNLGAGDYFFTVLAPGAQRTPNDGEKTNLSDLPGTAATGGTYANRSFSVTSTGTISPLGTLTHALDLTTNRIQLAPFATTPNNGGEYILAICSLPTPATPSSGQGAPGVTKSTCKHDAFKVETSSSVPVASATQPTVLKTATGSYTESWAWTINKSVSPTSVHTSASSGTFTYTITVTHTTATLSTVLVQGTVTVVDPNTTPSNGTTVPVTLSRITDTLSNLTTCTVHTATSSHLILTAVNNKFRYTCTFAATSLATLTGLSNTATAYWATQTLGNGATLTTGSAFWTVAVPFTGSDVNRCVTLTDTLTAGQDEQLCATSALATTTVTYSVTAQATAGQCVPQTNTATISTTPEPKSSSTSVTICEGENLIVTKTAHPSFKRTFTWTITKSVDKTPVDTSTSTATAGYTVTVDQTGVHDSTWQVTGTIKITNPNQWETILAAVSDTISGGGLCKVDGAISDVASVPRGTHVTLPYVCTFSVQPPTSVTNTATATWTGTAASTPTATATGQASARFTTPTTTVNETVTPTDAFNGGSGEDLCTLAGTSTCTLTGSSTTSNFTTHTYAYTRSVGATPGTCVTYPNTASTGTGSTSSASEQVCRGANLVVTKTAHPSFTRTYTWAVSKSVNTTRIDTATSGTFHYTVTVDETGFHDGTWEVAGTIRVANPNDWETISATVTDAISGGGTCKVDGHSSDAVSVLESSYVTVPYVCTYSTQPTTTHVVNVATATWTKTGASTPTGSATGTASATFTMPTTTVNKTITPKDTFNGGTSQTLCSLGGTTACTLTASNTTPYKTHTYTYSRTITSTAGKCVPYTNTAATGTGPTSSRTVTVCGSNVGGLTMGYWQNNNGQAIIKGAVSTSGVCTLTKWLRGYAPFQDLSATSSCATVAKYATNIIKSATAAGTAMNAMLKAQMLATALDVYFSTTSLGGNKTGYPTGSMGLGKVTIDLTNVLGSSVTGAFGGATHLTVLQILSYAASQSNAGGSTWYAQNKTTQGLAKNTFTAINNDQALMY